MAGLEGQEVLFERESRLGMTTFTFRSRRYMFPSVIVKSDLKSEGTCVLLDVGLSCPFCTGSSFTGRYLHQKSRIEMHKCAEHQGQLELEDGEGSEGNRTDSSRRQTKGRAGPPTIELEERQFTVTADKSHWRRRSKDKVKEHQRLRRMLEGQEEELQEEMMRLSQEELMCDRQVAESDSSSPGGGVSKNKPKHRSCHKDNNEPVTAVNQGTYTKRSASHLHSHSHSHSSRKSSKMKYTEREARLLSASPEPPPVAVSSPATSPTSPDHRPSYHDSLESMGLNSSDYGSMESSMTTKSLDSSLQDVKSVLDRLTQLEKDLIVQEELDTLPPIESPPARVETHDVSMQFPERHTKHESLETLGIRQPRDHAHLSLGTMYTQSENGLVNESYSNAMQWGSLSAYSNIRKHGRKSNGFAHNTLENSVNSEVASSENTIYSSTCSTVIEQQPHASSTWKKANNNSTVRSLNDLSGYDSSDIDKRSYTAEGDRSYDEDYYDELVISDSATENRTEHDKTSGAGSDQVNKYHAEVKLREKRHHDKFSKDFEKKVEHTDVGRWRDSITLMLANQIDAQGYAPAVESEQENATHCRSMRECTPEEEVERILDNTETETFGPYDTLDRAFRSMKRKTHRSSLKRKRFQDLRMDSASSCDDGKYNRESSPEAEFERIMESLTDLDSGFTDHEGLFITEQSDEEVLERYSRKHSKKLVPHSTHKKSTTVLVSKHVESLPVQSLSVPDNNATQSVSTSCEVLVFDPSAQSGSSVEPASLTEISEEDSRRESDISCAASTSGGESRVPFRTLIGETVTLTKNILSSFSDSTDNKEIYEEVRRHREMENILESLSVPVPETNDSYSQTVDHNDSLLSCSDNSVPTEDYQVDLSVCAPISPAMQDPSYAKISKISTSSTGSETSVNVKDTNEKQEVHKTTKSHRDRRQAKQNNAVREWKENLDSGYRRQINSGYRQETHRASEVYDTSKQIMKELQTVDTVVQDKPVNQNQDFDALIRAYETELSKVSDLSPTNLSSELNSSKDASQTPKDTQNWEDLRTREAYDQNMNMEEFAQRLLRAREIDSYLPLKTDSPRASAYLIEGSQPRCMFSPEKEIPPPKKSKWKPSVPADEEPIYVNIFENNNEEEETATTNEESRDDVAVSECLAAYIHQEQTDEENQHIVCRVTDEENQQTVGSVPHILDNESSEVANAEATAEVLQDNAVVAVNKDVGEVVKDATTDVASFYTHDVLTKEQAQQFLKYMLGANHEDHEKEMSDLQSCLSEVCQTCSSYTEEGEGDVKSEEVTTQEVTLVFAWPKKKGVPKAEIDQPFREIFLHRVTRMTDVDVEVIEGPTIKTIEYGKNVSAICGSQDNAEKDKDENDDNSVGDTPGQNDSLVQGISNSVNAKENCESLEFKQSAVPPNGETSSECDSDDLDMLVSSNVNLE